MIDNNGDYSCKSRFSCSICVNNHHTLFLMRLLPHVDADSRGGSMPSEGKEVARYRTGVPVTTRVRKDSAAGRILLQMMAQDAEERALEAQ